MTQTSDCWFTHELSSIEILSETHITTELLACSSQVFFFGVLKYRFLIRSVLNTIDMQEATLAIKLAVVILSYFAIIKIMSLMREVDRIHCP